MVESIKILIHFLYPAVFFILSGYAFILTNEYLYRKITLLTDRILASFFFGISLHTLIVLLENAVFHAYINFQLISVNFLIFLFLGVVSAVKNKRKILPHLNIREILVFFSLVFIFIFAFIARGKYLGWSIFTPRYQMGLFKSRFMDIDPYRHYIRTKRIVETGSLLRKDPYIVYEYPVRNMQGVYVINAIIIKIFNFFKINLEFGKNNTWTVCKYFPPLIGATSIFSIFLLSRYFFRGRILLAILSSIFIAANPLHIIRTNIFFTSSYALSLSPLVFLLLFWILNLQEQKHRISSLFSGTSLGLILTALSSYNLFIAENILIVMLFVASIAFVQIFRGGDKIRLKYCLENLMLAFFLFIVFVLIWVASYLMISLKEIVYSHLVYSFSNFTKIKFSLPEMILCFISQTCYPYVIKWNIAHLNYNNFYYTFPWYTFVSIFFFIGLTFLFLISWRKEDLNSLLIKSEGDGRFSSLLLLSMVLVPVAHMILALKGISPSFITKPYRYLTLSSNGFALVSALGFFWLVGYTNSLTDKFSGVSKGVLHKAKFLLRILSVILFLNILVCAREDAHWRFSFSEADYFACNWINSHIEKKAVLIVTYNEGDLIRSITERKVVSAVWRNPEVDYLARKKIINLPLINNHKDLLTFIKGCRYPLYLYIPGKYKEIMEKKFLLNCDSIMKKILAYRDRDGKTVDIYKIIK